MPREAPRQVQAQAQGALCFGNHGQDLSHTFGARSAVSAVVRCTLPCGLQGKVRRRAEALAPRALRGEREPAATRVAAASPGVRWPHRATLPPSLKQAMEVSPE